MCIYMVLSGGYGLCNYFQPTSFLVAVFMYTVSQVGTLEFRNYFDFHFELRK